MELRGAQQRPGSLLNEENAEAFYQQVLKLAEPHLSDEHFTVDNTPVEARASDWSICPKDEKLGGSNGSRQVNSHGERRSNATHRSTADPEARLYKKIQGGEAQLCYVVRVLMEHHHGLPVKTRLTLAMAKRLCGHKRAERTIGWTKMSRILRNVKLPGQEKAA